MLSSGAAFAAKNYLPDRDTPVPANQKIPTVDFLRPPLFSEPELNPSGTTFAAFTKSEHVFSIMVLCDLTTGKIDSSNSGIYRFDWIDDTHVLLNNQWNGVIDIKHPRSQRVAQSALSTDTRGLNRETGFIWQWPVDEPPYGMRKARITRVWGNLEDGKPLFCTTLEDDARKHLYRREREKWIECKVDLNEITPVDLGKGPTDMIVVGPASRGSPRALQRLDLLTGELGEVIYRDPEYDCSPYVRHRRSTREVIGVSVPAAKPRVVWFDQRYKEVQALLDTQFPNMISNIESADIKENQFMIESESDREAPAYLMLDFGKKSLRLVKRVYPWLDPARMSRMQFFQYKARDGVVIDGYLTLPPNVSAQHPVPMVVMIHSDPWVRREVWGMDRSAEFFASHGYAVFQPNYRGTVGYDSRIDPSDRFNFQNMSEDITDGVHALAQTGVIDSKRVAALGFGFGSYLAMCQAIDEPDLYRCAMIFGGVFDWEKLFRKVDSSTSLNDAWLEQRLKDFNLTAPSVTKRKDRIKIPIFITRNVDTSDSTSETQVFDFYLSMKKQVPCEFFGDLNIARDNEAYKEVVDRFDRFDAFLTKYCGPN